MDTIADRIRAVQDKLQLNDVELGKLVGATKATVGKWKNQNAVPSHRYLVRLREKRGIDDEWVLYGRGEMMVKVVEDDFTRSIGAIAKHMEDEKKDRLLDYARYLAEQDPKQN